ncbi:MAG: DNA/RNA helicase domain-containing protein [Clostridium sp.]
MGLVKTFEYEKDSFEKIRRYKYGKDWPVVYVLEGEKEAYIGETIHAYNRSQQHYQRVERRALDFIHIIADDDFNKSATLDIESLLIEYMAADGKYKLQNGNGGLTNHSYFNRQKYQVKFERIWEELRHKHIVQKGIFELRNSDLFKYSPYKALNEEQLTTVETIMECFKNQSKSQHILQGEPGTGKTIIAIYLMKYMKECEETKDKKIGLVVPMTSLRATLKNVFKTVKDLNAGMVLGPADVVKDQYDILIVDEAHRLGRRVNQPNMKSFDDVNRALGLDIHEGDQLDWITKSAHHIVLCYDKNQSVKPSDILPEKIEALRAQEHRITSQMRVMGGNDYINYIHNILHQQQDEQLHFEKYGLLLFEEIHSMDQQLREKNKEYQLCRMVAGYAWEWKSKKNPDAYDIVIQEQGFRWNSSQKDWVNSARSLEEVGCIHTIQGYDLNYVGVILGEEIRYEKGQIVIDEKGYFDRNGKRTIRDPEILKGYILNIYKTLLTRGIKGTYLYVCDSGLREYFQQFIPTYKSEGYTSYDVAEAELQVAENNVHYGMLDESGEG